MTQRGNSPVNIEACVTVKNGTGVSINIFSDGTPAGIASIVDTLIESQSVAPRVALEVVRGHVLGVQAGRLDKIRIESQRWPRRIAVEIIF